MMKAANNDAVRRKRPSFYALYIKRSIDFIISLLLLLILWPLFLILAIWIKSDSSGPLDRNGWGKMVSRSKYINFGLCT